MTGMLGPVDLLVIVVCVVAAVRLRAAGRLSRRVAIGLGALVLVTVVDLVLVWGGPWQVGTCAGLDVLTGTDASLQAFVIDESRCLDTAGIQPALALGLELAALAAGAVALVLAGRRSVRRQTSDPA
ncbi:hypothetical protein [Cellulomonas rhizosphaerae]|uniref:Uncharacterized protein n=1 Tax=Cellulomonas rhizosphaerae TaxID=2293719 RepID=A0A413RHG9_9CELL|nr:hypothetical protein [Cellulomonas rhizosphaerae]RHA37587.1 hypothetical protein D1825_17140 [Cellulomonas rhizosphaerae]